MSEHDRPLDPNERVSDAVGGLPVPEADPGFRARLRAEFVAGTLGETRGESAAESGAAGDVGGEPPADARGRVVPFPRRVVAVFAAAAMLAIVFLGIDAGPTWHIVSVGGEGTVRIGERVWDPVELAATLPRSLGAGEALRVDGEAEMNLACGDVLAAQMAPGSEMTLPDPPRRWTDRRMRGEALDGEVRFTTGVGFPGATLEMGAPAGAVRVTGTTFAVIVTADSTCVCVLDGTVEMVAPDGEATPVLAGKRRTVPNEPGAGHVMDIVPMERMKLQMFRDAAPVETAE
jgi:hypothetical protein